MMNWRQNPERERARRSSSLSTKHPRLGECETQRFMLRRRSASIQQVSEAIISRSLMTEIDFK
jgi:hypothetical protein